MNFEQQQLMLAVADAIEDDPASYDQSKWAEQTICGTVCCIAGWAVKLSSPKMFDINWRSYREVNSLAMYIESRAKVLLGLNHSEAYYLFHGGWQPAEDMSVPDALRKFAGGAKLSEVTGGDLVLREGMRGV